MYCKNCGKKLPDNARFCDRCNMSVRKKSDKAELIEELKEERLARRKAQAVQERLRRMQTKQREKRKKMFVLSFSILIIGIISGIVAYLAFVNSSNYNSITNGYIAETETQEASPATPTVTVIHSVTQSEQPRTTAASGTGAVSVNDNGYVEINFNNIRFAYPRGFERRVSDDTSVLAYFSDSDGDAEITVHSEDADDTAAELMKLYADRMGGTVVSSLAGERWYSITISRESKMYHRKAILSDGRVTYYEMVYPQASSKEGEYSENIEYMDNYFTGE